MPFLNRKYIVSVVLLLAVTFIVYAPVLQYGFVKLDDGQYTSGPITDGLTLANFKWAVAEFNFGYYAPLTLISHMLDARLFHAWSGGYHLLNLLLHLANTVLLLGCLLLATRAPWRSLFVAALFALHPLHVESVAWVAERKDVLSTFFELLALWAYLRCTEKKSLQNYGAVFLAFAAGLLCKPMVITFPFLLLLLDYWPLGRLEVPGAARQKSGGFWQSLKPLLIEKIPFFALIPVSAWLTALAHMAEKRLPSFHRLPLDQRFANALLSYGRYILNMFAPYKLVAYVPHPEGAYSLPLTFLAGLFLAACTLAAIFLGRRFRYLPTGWFWYLGSLIPAIGLIQPGLQASADRFTYIPLVGLFIIVVWGACEVCSIFPSAKRLPVWEAGIVLLLALAALARFQVTTWSSSEVLFQRILASYPQCELAHHNLGLDLMEQGRTEEAIAHFKEAVRLHPNYIEAQINLGVALLHTGRTEEAIVHFEEALRYHPDDADACYNLGLAMANLNRIPEAIQRFEQAVRINPNLEDAFVNLGVALDLENRLPDAVEQYRKAVRLRPDDAQAWDYLGLDLQKTNRLSEALENFQQAVRIDPNSADARCHWAVALVQGHRLAEAQEQYQQALRIKPDFTEARAGLQKVREMLEHTP